MWRVDRCMSDEPTKRVRVTISVECSRTMPREHIWPDGDGPENPTEDDVIKLIRGDLGIKNRPIEGEDVIRLLSEWNLTQHATLDVTVEAS